MTESHYLEMARRDARTGSDALVELRFRQAEEARRLRDLRWVTMQWFHRYQSPLPTEKATEDCHDNY